MWKLPTAINNPQVITISHGLLGAKKLRHPQSW
jgi:hypothetical protein